MDKCFVYKGCSNQNKICIKKSANMYFIEFSFKYNVLAKITTTNKSIMFFCCYCIQPVPLLMPFHQKSLAKPRKSFFEVVVVGGYARHLFKQRAEKLVIRWCKARIIPRMLMNPPFKLLETGFDDLCNMGPDIVVKSDSQGEAGVDYTQNT